MRVTLAQAAAFVIRRHGVGSGAGFPDAATAARAVLGLHAQLLGSAAMSAAARMSRYSRQLFHCDLYEDRTLVKTWCMRGTLHLLASDDLGLFVAAVMKPRAARHREFLTRCGFSDSEIAELPDRVVSALRPGPLPRRMLHEAVPMLARIPEAQWGQDIKDLCYLGLCVHARPNGNEVTFGHTASWLGYAPVIPDGPQAAAGLLRRYLAAYGPASAADFTAWAGFDRVAVARQARDLLAGEVIEVDLEDCRQPLWLLAADREELATMSEATGAFVLPRFDPLVLGLKDRRRFIADELRRRLFLPGGYVAATIWDRGRITGTWDHRVTGSVMRIRAHPFGPCDPATRNELTRSWTCLAPAVGADKVRVEFDGD